jgi:hypothetical protein
MQDAFGVKAQTPVRSGAVADRTQHSPGGQSWFCRHPMPAASMPLRTHRPCESQPHVVSTTAWHDEAHPLAQTWVEVVQATCDGSQVPHPHQYT